MGQEDLATSRKQGANWGHNNTINYISRVTTSLYKPSGICRVVFATNALGMAINFRDIAHVIHYGPPCNIKDFVQ